MSDSEHQPLLHQNVSYDHSPSTPPPAYTTHNQIDSSHDTDVGNAFRARSRSSMIDSLETVTLSWENVNVYVNPPKRSFFRGPDPNAIRKHVLRNVSGIVKPGTLLAIMGASGSGKTTLLNTLTSRTSSVMTTVGDIRVNGVNVGRGTRNISAYVQQDDLFFPTMTVREHLQFRALLRMEKGLSKARRLQRVEEVIGELGLTKCADNRIGNPQRVKGISGGEMRRLSFASEILTNPPLLFCDEATSGLDSFMAENIVQTLKAMAARGKTILCTIHQPSSEVYALFDQVLIMSEGRVTYMGESKGALDFFGSVGYPCPVNYNPADFYIMSLAVIPGQEEGCRTQIDMVCDSFGQSQTNKAIFDEMNEICSHPRDSGVIFEEAHSSSSRYESSWGRQFLVVLKRCWNTSLREPMVVRVRVMQTLIIGLMLGLIYLRLDMSQEGVMNINGILFLLLTNMTFSNIFAVVNMIGTFLGLTFFQLGIAQEDVMNFTGSVFLLIIESTVSNMFATLVSFPVELPIFLREYGVGIYRVDVYFISKMIAELPSFIFIPALFSSICYWMVGLFASWDAFLVCTGVLVLVANIAVSFGYLISASANSVNTALAVAPPIMIPLMMFGGFFLNADSIPKYFIWLEYLSWFKYSNELLAINQWENVDYIDCPNSTSTMVNTTSPMPPSCQRCFRNGQEVIDSLNFDKDNQMLDVILLLTLLVGFRILAYLVLLIKAKLSRA